MCCKFCQICYNMSSELIATFNRWSLGRYST
nr:MAG TPA: hypothetical protein [Caudoviricetes sp.]